MLGLPINIFRHQSYNLCPAACDRLDDPDVLTRRRPVWSALSDLWLDTEVDDDAVRYIAERLHNSSYDNDSLYYIAFYEVAPVVADNLFIPIGIWGMFDQEWLQQKIILRWQRRIIHLKLSFISDCRARFYCRFIRQDWLAVITAVQVLKSQK